MLIGGTDVLGADVAGAVPDPDRLGGADRYATSVAVAERALQLGRASFSRTFLATGRSYPDALTGGVLAARREGVLLLVDGTGADDAATRGFLARHPEARLETVLGGPLALGSAAAARVAGLFHLP